MSRIETKYISVISSDLRNFKVQKDNQWNFSCPICGDSKTNTRKARGFLLEYNNSIIFKCHNCSETMSFGRFLKQINPIAYQQYLLESISTQTPKDLSSERPKRLEYQSITWEKEKLSIPCITELEDNHPAVEYVRNRLIPEKQWKRIYYTENFPKFALDTFKQEKYATMNDTDRRIVLPNYSWGGQLESCQGRSIEKDAHIRYLSGRKISAESPLIFGLEALNTKEKIYVVEGAIDSLFLSNAISVGTSNLVSCTKAFIERQHLLERMVFVHDNQPKNPSIIAEMNKTIARNFKICIFPSSLQEKDLNEMVKSGIDILSIIADNTFQGLEAKIRLGQYSKV